MNESAGNPPELLTVPEIASYLGLDRDGHKHPELAVRRMLELGDLRGFKVCGRWRVKRADLAAFVDERLAAAATGG